MNIDAFLNDLEEALERFKKLDPEDQRRLLPTLIELNNELASLREDLKRIEIETK